MQTIQNECLNHFVVLGRRHLDHIVREYLKYYNTRRPHQAMDNEPLTKWFGDGHKSTHPRAPCTGTVRCQRRLGGLLRHYYRSAA